MTLQVAEDSLDELIEIKTRVENEIRQRARIELVDLDARRGALLKLLGGEPCVPTEKPASRNPPVVSEPKYRDPGTGKTWSGKGKRPFWFNADRANDFLIDPDLAA